MAGVHRVSGGGVWGEWRGGSGAHGVIGMGHGESWGLRTERATGATASRWHGC